MSDEEIVALALLNGRQPDAIKCQVEVWGRVGGVVDHVPVLSVDYDKLATAVVAALREAGRLVPETTRLFYGEPGDSFDQVEERAERSLREWRERIVSVGIHGGDTPVVEIAGPALVPEGLVAIDAARWERVRLVADRVHALRNLGDGDDAELCEAEVYEAIESLEPGDLDALPVD